MCSNAHCSVYRQCSEVKGFTTHVFTLDVVLPGHELLNSFFIVIEARREQKAKGRTR